MYRLVIVGMNMQIGSVVKESKISNVKALFKKLRSEKIEKLLTEYVRSPKNDCFITESLAKEAPCKARSLKIGKNLKKGKLYTIDPTNHSLEINLGSNECLRFDNPTLQTKLKELNNGESITIGSAEGNADILVGSNKTGVSDEHFKIRKIGDKFAIENTSPFETVIKETTIPSDPTKAQNATDLYLKIQKQLNLTTANDLNAAIIEVMSKMPDSTEQEVMTVMQKISPWGNYKSLENMADQLSHMGITKFYQESGLTLNTTLNYVGLEKGNFRLKGNKNKTAFILDKFSLEELEHLKKNEPGKFNDLIKNPDVEFISLDGWNNGLNIYNANASIADLSGEILTKAKQLQASDSSLSLDKTINLAMNKETLDRATALGINPTTISNTSVKNAPTSINQILSQIEPLNISNKGINAIIDATAEGLYPSYPQKYKKAKQLLIEFFDNQTDIYTPKTMMKELQNIHGQIINEVKQSGKSLDNIYYIIPKQDKSFEHVALNYAQANGIERGKFIYYNGISPIPPTIGKDATLVLLDDVVGSGNSMLDEKFYYKFFLKNCENTNQNILFAPIISSKQGADRIINTIAECQRSAKDKLIINPNKIKRATSEMDFYKNLSDFDRSVFNEVVGSNMSFRDSTLATVFPYMGPDNNAQISALLTRFFVLRPKALKVDLNFVPPKVSEKFAELLKQYGESLPQAA